MDTYSSTTQAFVPRLKDHCLGRLLDRGEDHPFTEHDRDSLFIYNDLLYAHATAQFNFTTYDVRRERDVINPDTDKCYIMLPNGEDDVGQKRHPFWYAKVLAVFHVKVTHRPSGVDKTRIDILFVRWFGTDPDWTGGDIDRRLDRIGFVPFSTDPENPAFGFVDPASVIRGCHLIPAFSEGRTNSLLGPSKFRDNDGDYVNYYVNR